MIFRVKVSKEYDLTEADIRKLATVNRRHSLEERAESAGVIKLVRALDESDSPEKEGMIEWVNENFKISVEPVLNKNKNMPF